MAGVTARTIQRIERGHQPSLETSKALASVFEVDLSLLQTGEETVNDTTSQPTTLASSTELTMDEQHALQYAKNMKAFWEYLITYVAVGIPFLIIFHGKPVVYLVLAGVGIGLVIQGLLAFEVVNFMTPGWERRLAERKLGRKL